jgi:hypothetical protein
MGNPKNQFPVDNFAIARTSGQIKGAKLDKDFSSNNFFRTSPINTPTLPVILSFTVTPAIPASGQNQVLSWVTTGGTSQSIDQGIGAVAASGNMTVAPSTNVTYTLSVTNNVGTVTQQVTATPILTPIENVFSAYTFNGNGGVQSINNGINLASSGGLVWLKQRSSVGAPELYDTVRGAANSLQSSNTSANSPGNNDLTAFLSNGFTLGFQSGQVNVSGQTQVAWTFAQAPGFFVIVPYTGDGVGGRTIAHALGAVPGLIIIKRLDAAVDWVVYHRSLPLNGAAPGYLHLDTTEATLAGASSIIPAAPTNAVFSVGVNQTTNEAGGSYIAYIFGHDTSVSGLIQCDSVVTGAGTIAVNLGWEPQFLLLKASSINDTIGWGMWDNARGWNITTGPNKLLANSSAAEAAGGISSSLTSQGFTANVPVGAGETYVYLAIRRGPMSQPTVGTQVYQGIARTGTSGAANVTGVGFPPDLVLDKGRNNAKPSVFWDRMRGATKLLDATSTAAEATDATALTKLDSMDGFGVGTDGSNGYINFSTITYINWCFRRYPGVFDIVAYTSVGAATNQRIPHNLGVVPELIITKGESAITVWYTWHSSFLLTQYVQLQASNTMATNGAALWGAAATLSDFGVNNLSGTGFADGQTNVAYLFATLAGISKVGSYTGNGTSLALACGFTGNARFFMCKRTDVAGDWFVWDTARGIGAGNDPHLSMNTAVAEVTTDDSVSAFTGGITVNQVAATNINVLNGTYIFLAIA